MIDPHQRTLGGPRGQVNKRPRVRNRQACPTGAETGIDAIDNRNRRTDCLQARQVEGHGFQPPVAIRAELPDVDEVAGGKKLRPLCQDARKDLSPFTRLQRQNLGALVITAPKA